jgi:hypothetical protein
MKQLSTQAVSVLGLQPAYRLSSVACAPSPLSLQNHYLSTLSVHHFLDAIPKSFFTNLSFSFSNFSISQFLFMVLISVAVRKIHLVFVS